MPTMFEGVEVRIEARPDQRQSKHRESNTVVFVKVLATVGTVRR